MIIDKLIKRLRSMFESGWGISMVESLVAMLVYRQEKDLSELADAILKSLDNEQFEYENQTADIFSLGIIVYSAYNQTGRLRYREFLDRLYSRMIELPRTKIGIFAYSLDDTEKVDLRIFPAMLTFYMIYEVNFNEKENINDLIFQLNQADNEMYDESSGLYYSNINDKQTSLLINACFCTALLEAFANSDEELFEHHKRVEHLFRKTLKGIMKHSSFKNESELLKEPKNSEDKAASMLVAYCIYKGITLSVLNSDLYLGKAESLINKSEDFLSCESGDLYTISQELAKTAICNYKNHSRPRIKGGYKNE